MKDRERSPHTPESGYSRGAGWHIWRHAWASVVARNTVLQFANQGFSIATGLVTFAMITRALGADAYGAFGLATTYAAFIAIILDAGLDTHIVNELAATEAASPRSDHARQLVSDGVLLRCVLWLIATVSAIMVGAVAGYASPIMLGVAMLSLNALIGAVGMLVTDIYQAAQDVRVAVLASFLSRVIVTVLLAWLYLAGLLNVESLFVVTLFGGISGFVAVLVIAIHQGLSFKRPSIARARLLYGATASLALWVVLGQVAHRADVIVLSIVPLDPSLELSNEHAVGIYVAAYRFFDLAIGLPGFIVVSLMPTLAHFASTDAPAYWTYLRRWIGRMGAIGVGIGAVLAVAGSPALLFIAGAPFEQSGPLVPILAAAIPFAFLTSLFFAAIVAIGARGRVVALYFIVASLNVGANILLTPKWGYWASAYLTTLSQAILALGMALILWKEMGRRS